MIISLLNLITLDNSFILLYPLKSSFNKLAFALSWNQLIKTTADLNQIFDNVQPLQLYFYWVLLHKNFADHAHQLLFPFVREQLLKERVVNRLLKVGQSKIGQQLWYLRQNFTIFIDKVFENQQSTLVQLSIADAVPNVCQKLNNDDFLSRGTLLTLSFVLDLLDQVMNIALK